MFETSVHTTIASSGGIHDQLYVSGKSNCQFIRIKTRAHVCPPPPLPLIAACVIFYGITIYGHSSKPIFDSTALL